MLHLQPEKQLQRQTAVWAGCLEPRGWEAEQPHKPAASLPSRGRGVFM